MRIEGKVALITGATGGIGSAMAKLFLDEGAKVVLTGRSQEKLSSLLETLGNPDNAMSCVVEALDEGAVKKSLEVCQSAFGGLDVIVANAGTEGIVQPLEAYSVNDFNQTLMVNVTGVWLYLKHGLPLMRQRSAGSFIAISSGAGLVGFPGLCPYSASKHAVCGMVKTACLENAAHGIRVNALAPGPTDTRMMESLGEQINSDDPSAVREMVSSNVPMQRYGTSEEIANLALFLASDESSFCNGAVYLADGGFTAA